MEGSGNTGNTNYPRTRGIPAVFTIFDSDDEFNAAVDDLATDLMIEYKAMNGGGRQANGIDTGNTAAASASEEKDKPQEKPTNENAADPGAAGNEKASEETNEKPPSN